jgi:hypothetical protein
LGHGADRSTYATPSQIAPSFSRIAAKAESGYNRADAGSQRERPCVYVCAYAVIQRTARCNVRNIVERAISLKKKNVDVKPEIMIPLVSHVNELQRTHETVLRIVKRCSPSRRPRSLTSSGP